MRLMLLGAPGAGKGTQALSLTKHFHIPSISTGEMLRAAIAAKTALGQQVQAVMEAGQLVSDALIMQIVQARLQQSDCQSGYLLDGFPRTLAQASQMREANISVTHIIELIVPDEAIILRLSGRRIHAASGRVYHDTFNPPLKPGLDDNTGEPLIQREDDCEATIKKRLEVYHAQTQPLVAYYQAWADTQDPSAPHLHRISGLGKVEAIFKAILAAVGRQLMPLNSPFPAGDPSLRSG